MPCPASPVQPLSGEAGRGSDLCPHAAHVLLSPEHGTFPHCLASPTLASARHPHVSSTWPAALRTPLPGSSAHCRGRAQAREPTRIPCATEPCGPGLTLQVPALLLRRPPHPLPGPRGDGTVHPRLLQSTSPPPVESERCTARSVDPVTSAHYVKPFSGLLFRPVHAQMPSPCPSTPCVNWPLPASVAESSSGAQT